MQAIQLVCCPNCGSAAERYHCEARPNHKTQHQPSIRTQCHQCDYLMVTCAQTGKVIEAYAPGIPFAAAVSAAAASEIGMPAVAHKPRQLLAL